MMGAEGLKKSSQVAVLNANYMVQKLKDHFQIAYTYVHKTHMQSSLRIGLV